MHGQNINRKLGCGFLFAFSNYGRICSRLWDI